MPDPARPARAARGTERVRRYLTRAGLRAALPYLALGVLLIVAVVLVGREVDRNLGAIESWVARLGPWGVVAFAALFVLTTSVLVPDTVLCLMAGALFGLTGGSAAVVAASLLSAMLQYALARRLLRARIERLLAARPTLADIRRAVLRDELRLQVLLRLAPLNPATISYVLGAAGVRFGGFLLASLALAPNLILAVYFGHAATHVARAAGGAAGAERLHDLALAAGAALGIFVMVVVSRTARRALLQAVAERDSAPAATDRPQA